MNGFPSEETVKHIKEMYPEGCRIELVSMDDPFSKLAPGCCGTVRHVDDARTIFVNWDCGSRLGVVYGEDVIRILKQKKNGFII